jgi:transcription elongation factor Elf1
VFRCPVCEGFPLRIIIAKDGLAKVQCAYCGFSREDVHVNAGAEPIDVYSKLTAMEGN